MFFPISDDDRELNGPAIVTYALLAANLAIFVCQISNPDFTYGYSVIPREITTGEDLVGTIRIESPNREPVEIPQTQGPSPIWLTLFSSMFMHAGFAHIATNMLYLWIFGDNVEHRFGWKKFLLFYLAAGLAASAVQIALNPNGILPNLGASGAIAGLLGAYMVLFPYNKVNVIFLFSVISVPAFLVLGLWIASQLVSGYGSLFAAAQTGGVAYGAHIGGFVAGIVGGLAARWLLKEEPDSVLFRNYQRDPAAKRLW